MPKLVDTTTRAAIVHDVVCRIVAREGVAAASVRRVAEESGLSANALRHVWPSQQLLQLRVVQRLARSAHDNLPRWGVGVDAVEHARAVLGALVPSEEVQIVRSRAWRAFTA